ncbi:MAG: type II secretion system F family protein [Parvibaculum sp.]|uniref:type II secretion system F family protein n=1 Tax=Parvibaculum sp. TaxID=2024848 RepID=UPI001DD63FF3|nr:type II secretion system F family protein [Parvibaculum sp.]MBX3490073.1 type II secretion system F family protein [Parvibaculum sp.]MBX3495032.1 type II secretion system F family protein [Parvibaculum sp.]MCW5725939.1 type II secretion system F family protein [Parvibaculum sp.]
MTSLFLAVQEMFNVENVVMLLTAVAAFATILTLTAPMLAGDKLGTRMKYVSTEREAMRARARENLAQEKTRLRQTSKGFIKDVVERFARGNVLENTAIKEKLRQAGFRGPGPMYTFVFFRFVMPPILFVLTLLYLAFVNDFGLPAMSRFAASCGAAFVGFYLPSLFVENVIARRQDSIRKAFPDALDLLLICVESGMSIEAAFQKVASEIGTQSVELAEELGLATAELSYLQERRQAYENLASRTGLPGVKAVATSLIQAERYGTPLGQSLRVMAQENRDMRMADAEKKAAGLPPKLTVPMILFFLPVLFGVILGPAIIKVMSG